MPGKRGALYVRVSTEEQVDKYGLAAQLTWLRALAAHRGLEIAPGAEFVDDGYSGAELDRPALTRLRDASRAGAVDELLVLEHDRLSRRVAHQFLLFDEFERAGVRIVFSTGPREATSDGRMFDNMKAVFAEYERAKIKDRTTRGRLEKARQGLLVGGPFPYGYRADPERPGRVIVDEEQAAVVRMMFGWLAEEHRSARSITLELQALGFRPARGTRWARSSVTKIVTNRFYTGQAFYNRREVVRHPMTGRARGRQRLRAAAEWIPLVVPAVITPDLFERAQRQLASNRALLVGRPSPFVYLLRGLLVCGECGRRLVGVPYHGHRFYRCAGHESFIAKQAGARCPSRAVKAERVEQPVWEAIAALLADPERLTAGIQAHAVHLGAREIEAESKTAHLHGRLAQLAGQERRLLDLYVEPELQTDEVRRRLREVVTQRQQIGGELAQAERRASAKRAQASDLDHVHAFCARALRGLHTLTDEGRQQLLRLAIDRVVRRGDELEIIGVLPGLPAEPRPELTTAADHCGQFGGLPYRLNSCVAAR